MFISRLGGYILEMMNHAVNVIQGYCGDIKHLNFFGSDSFLETTSSVVTSFRSFASSFIFNMETCHKAPDVDLSGAFNLSMENLLKALSHLYQEYSISNKNLHSEANLRDFDAPVSPLANSPSADAEVSRILDMELDVNNDSNDMDIKRSMMPGMLSATVWKLKMISLISSFSSVLLEATWEVLFVLFENECDSKVSEDSLINLSCFSIIGVSYSFIYYFLGMRTDYVSSQSKHLVVIFGKSSEHGRANQPMDDTVQIC